MTTDSFETFLKTFRIRSEESEKHGTTWYADDLDPGRLYNPYAYAAGRDALIWTLRQSYDSIVDTTRQM